MVELQATDLSKLEELSKWMKESPLDRIQLVSRQAYLMDELITSMKTILKEQERDLQRQRMAQGGPRLMAQTADIGIGISDTPIITSEERDAFLDEQQKEKLARFQLIHSFGHTLAAAEKEKATGAKVPSPAPPD